MELSLEMIVSIGALFASVITSFVVTKTKVQDLDDHVREANKRLAQLDSRLDKNDTATHSVDQRLKVISNMMDPKERETEHRRSERQTVLLEGLRRDVDVLQHMHNGRHPPIKSK
tara:strand:+ start:572 stop:916 length:345 start_codon:yes stop_codon:yes gene_type:complete